MKTYMIYCFREHFRKECMGYTVRANNITEAQEWLNANGSEICIAMPCYIENLMILKEKGTTFVGDYATAWTTLCSIMDFTYVPVRGAFSKWDSTNSRTIISTADGTKTLKDMFEEIHGVGSLPTNTA